MAFGPYVDGYTLEVVNHLRDAVVDIDERFDFDLFPVNDLLPAPRV